MQFDRGYISARFVTDTENMEAVLENPLILVYGKRISSMTQLLPILEKVVASTKTILIIAEDVDGEALSTLVANKIRGNIKVIAIKAPGFGDRKKAMLEDIAILTGAQLINDTADFKLETATLSQLGSCTKVTVSKDATMIVGGRGKKANIVLRVNEIKAQIKKASTDYDKEILQERLSKIDGGVAVLYIGAVTETEMKEKKDRIDDALHATRAAIEEGIVPGGGVAYIRVQSLLDKVTAANEDESAGINIVRKAIEEPLRQICANAAVEASVVIQKVRDGKGDFGFNARTEIYEKLYDAGVIDPTKVTRIALENAASIASLLLTTECVLSIVKKENPLSQILQ
jgi:chaperonin GroEL